MRRRVGGWEAGVQVLTSTNVVVLRDFSTDLALVLVDGGRHCGPFGCVSVDV